MATVIETTARDAAASTSTTYTMAVGDTFNGVLSDKPDEDWIEIRLTRGETYKISLSGRGSKGDEAEDTILKVYDAAGRTVLAENDDINTAARIYDSELEFTPTSTGTYYISASSYAANPNRDNSGAYSLTVVLADGTTPPDPTPPDPTPPDPTPAPDITGTNASETLRGTEQGETISGLGGSDTIFGLGGNDTLDGGSGGDTLEGGAGADVLIGGTGANTASYSRSDAGVTVRLHSQVATGGDARGDTFGSMVTFTYTDNGRSMSVQLPDIINLTGSDGDDVLAGDARVNTLRGGDGDDTLYGGPGGNNTNDDRLYGEEGDDKLYGGRGDDRLYGGDDNDLLRGGPHNDLLEGGDGEDDLAGGDGNDTLEGGAGEDILSGDAGNDELQGNAGDDTLAGGAGRDDLFGGAGNDIVDGGNDNDDLFGGDGDDTLIGGNGNDDLEGQDGDDILEGGAGDDDLLGGFGADTFKFSSGDGDDVIEDFEPGQDKIDLSTITSIDDFSDLQDDIRTSGNNVVIELPSRGEVTLENISSVGEDDFIFSGSGGGGGGGNGGNGGTGGTPGTPGTPITGDPDDDRLHGNASDDNLDGGGGNDVLYGARGNDVLRGGPGSDSFEGGPGNDVIIVDFFDFTNGEEPPDQEDRDATLAQGVFDGGENDDGTKDSDTLSFADFDDDDADGDGNGVTVTMADAMVTYRGTTSATNFFKNIENLIGSPDIDSLTGDAGDNIIEGGPGGDTLNGGSDGEDTVSYRSSSGKVEVVLNTSANFGDARGDGVTGFDNLIGSAFDDVLTGDTSPNVIEGLAGADTLNGGGGGDTLSYESSDAGVTVDLRAGTGNNSDMIRTSSGGHAAGDKVPFNSFANIIGSAHADTLTGDNNNNTLEGRGGNDKLNGDGGDDTLNGGPGGDTLDGGIGEDTVTYSDATEGVTVDLSSVSINQTTNVVTIRNGSGQGEARGDTFIDIENFTGSPHDDTFIAGQEEDDIDAGEGVDTISYERSRKPVDVTLADVGTNASAQSGGLHANVGDNKDNYAQGDTLDNFEKIIGSNRAGSNEDVDDGNGNMIHDRLIGNSSANVIDGRNGNDKIEGGGGNDTLIGGSGNDFLTGDGGVDTFVISGRDTITDFVAGDNGDKLSFGSSPRTLNLNYQFDSNELVITSGSHRVTIDDITDITGFNTLTAANFIFSPDGYVKLTDNSPAGDGSTRGNSTILGGAGDNSLTGGSNADRIFGGRGDDTIEGRAGSDELDGGEGDEDNGDTLSYAGSPQRSRSTTNNDQDTAGNPYRTGVTVTLNGTAVGPGTYAEGDTNSNFENLIGSSRDDELTGDGEANIIDGGAGNDTIAGGGGADTLKGGSGSDVISGGSDGDKVEGGSGSDRLSGSGSDFLSYEGGSGVTVDLSDTTTRDLTPAEAERFGQTTAETGLTIIEVSRGDASGDIATGFDNVIGSRGGDTLIGDDDGNELRGLGGNDTLTGKGGVDMLKGGAGNDMLNGSGGNDTLDGGPGADKLDGGTETDIATYASAMEGVTVDLSGGGRGRGDAAGDTYDNIEQYVGSEHDDVFIAGKDEHDITGGTAGSDTVSYERSEKGVTVDLSTAAQSSDDAANPDGSYARGDTLTSIENVIGSNHDDVLTAVSTGSVINGGRGRDELNGGGGSDTFVFAGGDGRDEVFIFGNTDKIDLSAFTNIASMDDLDISPVGAGDANTEIILPNSGVITLNAFAEATLTADNFIFYTKPISGNIGDHFNNEINGGRGDDAIYGEQGRDILNGGAGDDEIYGGEDKDTINGGEGNDLLDGGPGADTFVFEPGNGNDHIMDFTDVDDAAIDDRIDLSAFTNGGSALTISDVSDAGTSVGNYVIDLTDFGGGMITVLGVTSLGADDFFFGS